MKCIVSKDNIIYKPQTEFIYNLTTNSSLIEGFVGHCADTGCQFVLKMRIMNGCFYKKQTSLVYAYYENDEFLTCEETGLDEQEDWIWIHPPRALIPETTFSPFLQFDMSKMKWSTRYLFFNNKNRSITHRKIGRIKNTFKRSPVKVEFETPNLDKTFICEQVDITSIFKGEEFDSYFLFNEEVGFTKVNVTFINGTSYQLTLVEINHF